MAELRIEGNELALYLSAAEKVGAVHGDLRVPLSAVRRVDVLADAHGPADHGIKLGTRIPGGGVGFGEMAPLHVARAQARHRAGEVSAAGPSAAGLSVLL